MTASYEIGTVYTGIVNIRVDTDLKQSAEALFDDLGLTMSAAITMFLKSAVNHDGIPFEVKRTTPNTETRTALSEYEDMQKNPGNYKRYASFDDIVNEVLDNA